MRKRKGDFSIDMSLILLLVMALLVLGISVFGVTNQISKLNTVANEMARYIEIRGANDSQVAAEFHRLSTNSGMNATMTVEGSYYSGNRLQLGEAFTVRLSASVNMGIGGIVKIPITIKAAATGRSEKLWK